MAIQRNDPCPCGSGQKYKKCCMRTEQARAGLQRSTTQVTDVITPETIPYAWGKAWNSARARGDFGLLYDMTFDGGPYRARFASREDFYLKAQGNPVPGGADWRLKKIKLDEQRAFLLSTRGEHDSRVEYVEAELLELRRTADGWRLADARSARRARAEVNDLFVGFTTFDVENIEDPWRLKVQEGWERPDLADHPPAEETEAAASVASESEAEASSASAEEAVPPDESVASVDTSALDESQPSSTESQDGG